MAKYLDENGLLYYNQKVNAKLEGKVDKASGKGLSTNDYTTAEKNKLASIDANAQANKINSISVNGTSQNIDTNKNVEIKVPTKVSDLNNDSGFQNAAQVQSSINDALKDMSSFGYEVVTTLPTNGVKGVIYLVPNSGAGQNVYDEYIWMESTNSYEKIGNTSTDLSNYWSKDNLTALTNAEIDEALA